MKPNFENLLKVLRKEPTHRPVLFEFIINDGALEHFAGTDICNRNDALRQLRIDMHGFFNAGYDYAVIPPWHANLLRFPTAEQDHKSTISLNGSVMITDAESFEKYAWPEISNYDYTVFDQLEKELPDGAKLISCGYGGVLETVISLTGYENLCIMALMDEELTASIFDEVGKRMYAHFDLLSDFNSIGAIIHSDDWGFKTQPMLSPEMLEKYLYPWHKKIADRVHSKNKPIILHSCGNPDQVIDAIIDHIKYDGKHSFEDGILPIEEAYKKWDNRIALLGGIDVDFLARHSPEDIYLRTRKLIEQTQLKGGYAIGSGNSIPSFVPLDNFKAMLKAVHDYV